jgi:hypothetical protein
MRNYVRAAVTLAGVYWLGYNTTKDLMPFMNRGTAIWLTNKIGLWEIKALLAPKILHATLNVARATGACQ